MSSRALALVHLAMYDAFAGVADTPAALPAYLSGLPRPTSTASSAAAVAAAHATLSSLFPSQKTFFDAKHLQADLQGTGPQAEEPQAGHLFGLAVARAILFDRKDDPTASDRGYAAGGHQGGHRPDPDNPGQGFPFTTYPRRPAAADRLGAPQSAGTAQLNVSLGRQVSCPLVPRLLAAQMPLGYSPQA